MSLRLARVVSAALLTVAASASVFAAAGPLIWRGDVTVARGVVGDVAKAWEKAGNGKIEVQSFNTASGLDALEKGQADLAGTARPAFGAAEAGLTFTPVAWDGVVLITHASNPVTNITMQQLHDIYYGKITNWKELGGKDEGINVYAAASPGDGVEWSLRKLVFGRGNQPVAAPRLYVNQAKLEEGIGLDTRGFGATTLSGAAGNKKLKMISVDGVAPSMSTVASGSYPLYTQLYLVTNPASPKAADAKALVDFVTDGAGKSLLRSHSLLPYADGASLVSADAGRRARILASVGAKASASEPLTTAAPAVASAPAAAAAAPSRPLTKAEKLAAARAAAKEKAASAPPSQFAGVTSSVFSTARAGFAGITSDAITVSDQAKIGGRFAKVTSDAVTVAGKPTAKPAVDTREKPSDKVNLGAAKVGGQSNYSDPGSAAPSQAEIAKAEAERNEAIAKAAASKKKTSESGVAAKVRGQSNYSDPGKSAGKSIAKAAKPAQTYTVKPGDTLYSIAKKHNADIAKVRQWNGLKGDSVKLGQTLKVSGPR
jgi:phosphate transport system substrate-binding protein